MNEITIFIQDELKLYLKLFHIINKIYFLFDKIYIVCDNKYLFINFIIFANLYNVIFVDKKYKKKYNNIINFNDSQKFIEDIKIKNFIIANNFNSMIFRDVLQENICYIKLKENVQENYIFFFNYDTKKIINYFGDLYIFNPMFDFYEEDDDFYGKWVDLKSDNISYYLKIVENATELHIYDIDILYLILEIDVSHIENKYFYHDDLMIKEDDNRLKSWKVVLVK